MMLALSRTGAFVLDGELPEQSIRFLQALPELPEPVTADRHTIRVNRRSDGFVDAQCSWGRTFIGSDRTLTRILDADFLRLAMADAGSMPILASTVLRADGTRIALIGADEIVITQMSIALIEAGVAFEGSGFSFIGPDGLQPHPRKPHLNRGRIQIATDGPPGWAVEMPYAQNVTCSVVDPTFGGEPWRVMRGPVQRFIFVESNDHGRASTAPIAQSEALKRAMRHIHVPVTTALGLSLIYKMLAGASYSRLTLGCVRRGADLILAPSHAA